MCEVVYPDSSTSILEKRAITHFGMALNDAQCQWEMSREHLRTLDSALQYAQARENIISDGRLPAKLHHLQQSDPGPNARVDNSKSPYAIACMLQELKALLTQKQPMETRRRYQDPNKCQKCGGNHPLFKCIPCYTCGGAHYNNDCPKRKVTISPYPLLAQNQGNANVSPAAHSSSE